MKQDMPKARMIYQTSFPVSLRGRLDSAASNLDMSLNAYVARLLRESVIAYPRLEDGLFLEDEPMCKPFSLRLPSATMLIIQDGALAASRTINTEILLRLFRAMELSSILSKPLSGSAAWERLSAAIDVVLSSAAALECEHLSELSDAKSHFESSLPISSAHSRSGLSGDLHGN